MEQFYKLLESAKVDKEHIHRKMVLLSLTITREPALKPLADDPAYVRAVDAYREVLSDPHGAVRDMNLTQLNAWKQDVEDKTKIVLDIVSAFCEKNKKALKKAKPIENKLIANVLSHSKTN